MTAPAGVAVLGTEGGLCKAAGRGTAMSELLAPEMGGVASCGGLETGCLSAPPGMAVVTVPADVEVGSLPPLP